MMILSQGGKKAQEETPFLEKNRGRAFSAGWWRDGQENHVSNFEGANQNKLNRHSNRALIPLNAF